MTGVALKGLFARRVRAILTALAIVLGVAMVGGSFVLTDTISKAFDSIFTSSYSHTDAVVSGKKLVDYSNSGNATVSRAVLEQVKRSPDVAAAAGALIDLNGDSTHATLLARGKAIQSNGNPTFGFGIDTSQPRFNPLKKPRRSIISPSATRSGSPRAGRRRRSGSSAPPPTATSSRSAAPPSRSSRFRPRNGCSTCTAIR